MEAKVMEVINYEKQTSKTKYIIEAALEYRPPLNMSHNFFSEKKSRGFYLRKYVICKQQYTLPHPLRFKVDEW